MCTVTYIPKGKDHFILTSNRDENAARSPKNITEVVQDGIKLVFPRDTMAGGTWIAVAEDNRIVCLLNGAFDQHDRQPPYRRSRGLMVLDFFSFKKAPDFFRLYTFEGMEPFTMVIYDKGNLYDFRWDEEKTHLKMHDPLQNYIWSSPTLYTAAAHQKRIDWFKNWKATTNSYDREAILDFHQTAGDGDPYNDIIMNRNGMVQTVSITSIVKSEDYIDLQYLDLMNKQVKQSKIILQGEVVASR